MVFSPALSPQNDLPASTPASKSCDSSPPQDASTPGPSSASHLRQLAAKPAPSTDSIGEYPLCLPGQVSLGGGAVGEAGGWDSSPGFASTPSWTLPDSGPWFPHCLGLMGGETEAQRGEVTSRGRQPRAPEGQLCSERGVGLKPAPGTGRLRLWAGDLTSPSLRLPMSDMGMTVPSSVLRPGGAGSGVPERSEPWDLPSGSCQAAGEKILTPNPQPCVIRAPRGRRDPRRARLEARAGVGRVKGVPEMLPDVGSQF